MKKFVNLKELRKSAKIANLPNEELKAIDGGTPLDLINLYPVIIFPLYGIVLSYGILPGQQLFGII